MKQSLCAVNDIPEHGSKLVEFFGRQVHVYKHNGTPKAALNICMHVGGTLDFNGDKFVCQWHKAEFGADGACLKGPAPSASRLMYLPTRIEDGILNYVWGE